MYVIKRRCVHVETVTSMKSRLGCVRNEDFKNKRAPWERRHEDHKWGKGKQSKYINILKGNGFKDRGMRRQNHSLENEGLVDGPAIQNFMALEFKDY